MASLLENLIDVLDQENTEYEKLVVLSDRKTPVIIQGDIDTLGSITEQEQEIVGIIQHLEKQRTEALADIANVVNRDVENLKLINLIQMLAKRPEQQEQLTEVHNKLKATIQKLKELNEKNQMLLGDAMEMVDFNLKMLQGLKSAPQTANYSKNAYCTGSSSGRFRRKTITHEVKPNVIIWRFICGKERTADFPERIEYSSTQPV